MSQRGWFEGPLLALCLALCLMWLGLRLVMIQILPGISITPVSDLHPADASTGHEQNQYGHDQQSWNRDPCRCRLGHHGKRSFR